MSTLANKSAAMRFYEEVLNRRQLHLIDELVAQEWVDHNPDPGTKPGAAGLKGMFREVLEAFPDLRVTVHSLVAEGDKVGVYVSFEGTHLAAYMGLPATGRQVSVTGFDWMRFAGGKAAERWGVFDQVGMMQQLGAMPGPTPGDLKATSRRYYEALDKTKGDVGALVGNYLHANCVTHFGGQPHPLDVEGVQGLARSFWTAFPDLVHTIKDQVCEGDRVFTRMTAKATHKGEFAGARATNKVCEIDVISAQQYTEGKIVEQWVQIDLLGLLSQIGLVPPPK
ncbi:MAG: ester cyclase [Deltaproteobacteria bacterium]|nr:ester cyclase [Deltaproteobacteria bacterium]